ncbi:HPr family phosphocarrier protein [Agaribacterium haliotis]|uniref:HPr family phosphocarrier protein n=1 Tax=Agaribacterium haliotis TaxID=2013869 RepID=UPI000BB55A48|nr:HPr family phosphocarrier protein [Agaribacterium haliotis]
MKQQQITIVNKLGLHARAATKFANVAKQYAASIEVEVAGKSIDGKSIMSLMLLAASKGTEIVLRTDGNDEDKAMKGLCELINNRFDEDE